MLMRNRRKLLVVIGMLLLCDICLAATNGKKVIEFGWDMPDTGFVKKNIAQMENTPFDGLAIAIKGKRTDRRNLGWYAWSRNRLKEDDYVYAIDDLKSTPFRRFTDNFILLTTTFPDKDGEVGWLDPEWSSIAYNAGCIAKVAKQGGCKGILLDTEHYTVSFDQWRYETLDKKQSFEAYASKAKERGREFIRAINREYPDITILILHGYGTAADELKTSPDKRRMGLLVPFMDGMCEAAAPETVIVDGFETAYGFISKKAFSEARETIYEKVPKELTSCPDQYRKHVQLGLPVYPDHWPFFFYGKKSDHYESLYSPELFQTAIANAAAVSDKYVWVYTEFTTWWDTGLPDAPANAGKPFRDALKKAKSGPAGKDLIDRVMWPGLLDLQSDGWKYSNDRLYLDNAIKWFAGEFDDAAWKTGDLSGVNREDSYANLGYSFFRKSFDVGDIPGGLRSFVCGTSESEYVWVWINGKYAGCCDMKDHGAMNVHFALEVTDIIRPKGKNTIAIRTKNTEGPGGMSIVRISNAHAVKDGSIVTDWR